MREIKFKAKRVSDGEWLEGDLIHYAENDYRILDQKQRYWDIQHDADEIDPNTLCQFTGLTDKNGKEVYEGDIYFINNKDYCISFYSGCFVGHRLDASALISSPMGWCYDEDSEGELVVDDFYKQIEIIGNIHDK